MTTQTQLAKMLDLDTPIVQGPFGGGISTIELTTSVSNLGGLGSFGAHLLDPQSLLNLVKTIEGKTKRAFAINLWVSDHDPGGLNVSEDAFETYWRAFQPYYEELGIEKPDQPVRYHENFDDQVAALIEARPPAFSFVFGIPSTKVLNACRKRRIKTIGAATTLSEARALDGMCVDAIVATGFEAGGHRPSFINTAEDSLMSTASLIQITTPRVTAPVIAAGGIVDQPGIRAAIGLGASAAQLGTAFLACEESGTSDAHRAVLFSSEVVRDTKLTRTYTGRLARGVTNRLITELESKADGIAPFPVQSFFVSNLKTACAERNRTDLTSLYAGQSAPNLKHRNVADLMAALTHPTSEPTDTPLPLKENAQ